MALRSNIPLVCPHRVLVLYCYNLTIMQNGATPLAAALYLGHTDVVARLLKAKATSDIQGEVKSSTLRWDGCLGSAPPSKGSLASSLSPALAV